jgi:predicted secreted protein
MGSKNAGRLALLAISTDGGNNYTTVSDVVSIKRAAKRATIKRTTHDDADNETYGSGRKDATLSCEAKYVEDDAGQEACWVSYEAGTTVYFRYRPTTGAGKKQFYGQGIITDMSDDSPNDDDTTLSISIQLSGAQTRVNQ